MRRGPNCFGEDVLESSNLIMKTQKKKKNYVSKNSTHFLLTGQLQLATAMTWGVLVQENNTHL